MRQDFPVHIAQPGKSDLRARPKFAVAEDSAADPG
jgi:hypothetical protein